MFDAVLFCDVRLGRIDALEFRENIEQTGIEVLHRLFPQCGRNAVVCLGDAAGDCSERVAVSADRDRVADGVLKAGGFEERLERLRYGVLTGLIKLIGRTDFVQREVERIVIFADMCADFR